MPSKSAKQARLMAAVAHNPKFAKKVGIPQSVGQEFHAADKRKGRFAEGGKVKTLKRLKDQLAEYSMWGHNSDRYTRLLKDWDPDVDDDDITLMGRWADGSMWGWKQGDPNIARMDELVKKYGIRPRDLITYRGMELPPDVLESFKPGDYLSTFRPQSSTTEFGIAEDFAHIGNNEREGWLPTILRISPSERKVLPLPYAGQSELVIPSGEAGRLGINKIRPAKLGGFEIEVDPVPHPGFADGGQVLPSSKDDEESWSDTYLKRPLSGLASMWGGTDPETGEFISPAWQNLKRAWNVDERRRQGLPPQERATLGIVDETLSLPALGGLVGLPVPEFASEAEERASTTREAARTAVGVDAPHGFAENIAESAGVMAGQLPVPANVAGKLKLLKESGKLGKIGKILGPAAEWFSPTVVPKASNYIKGTLFGGILGGGLDYLGDYMDEKEATERNKQFISEAIAEVLEEERVKAAEESGDETSDDEALAELGYAEGGKVTAAKKAITSLRQVLSETEPADAGTRKAAIDTALRALNVPGTVELPKTIRAGLNEQREPSAVLNLLGQAEPLLQPARQMGKFDPKSIVSNLPAPSKIVPTENIAHGTMSDLEHTRLLERIGYHDRGANRHLSEEMAQMEQDDLDWEKMHGYAEGGKVANTFVPVPQAQKEEMAAQQGQAARTGAPLSQEWYENYGAGPEHLFLGDRTVKLPDYWGPQHPSMAPPTQQTAEGSWLPAAGIVGMSLYDEWKKKRAEGQDTSQQAFWQDMHASAANTSDTDAWVNQQLDQYGNSAPMPVMGEDGSISYVQPDQFWRNMHDSAANTSNTDAWVNSQLENYNSPMPVINDDGTVSYVNAQGEPVSAGGLNLGRAWQGATGAYDVYAGLERGDVGGYAQALQGVNDLYGSYTGTGTGALGGTTGAVSGLADMYTGIEQGGLQGYTQAAQGAVQTANSLGYGSSAAGAAAGKAVPVVAAATGAYNTYEAAKVGNKKGAVAQGAATGAAIGSIIPGIGTAVGAVVGAVVGLIGASLGDKDKASESYYGAYKKLDQDKQIRGWTPDQVGGAVFETIKSHTKSGNINKFPDVSEMYTAFGITKDAQKNYKNVQAQMGDFIKGVIGTAQQMGSLPTDPTALRQLDGQQIYYKVVVPALAAKFKEQTGKESSAWNVDKINPGTSSQLQNLFADWTDWMTSHWDQKSAPATQSSSQQGGLRIGGGRVLERARGGRVQNFHDDPRSGALAVLQ